MFVTKDLLKQIYVVDFKFFTSVISLIVKDSENIFAMKSFQLQYDLVSKSFVLITVFDKPEFSCKECLLK